MWDTGFGTMWMLLMSSVWPMQVRTAAVALPAESRDAQNAPANVILITVSSLGAAHVGCLGYGRETTPRFDKFARSSALFRRAYAASSWAMPTHGSIFTSLYPSEHGATHVRKTLADAHGTLAEILQEQGYFCASFGCNPQLTSDLGFAQGFHTYDDFSARMLLTTMEAGDEREFDINQHRTNDLINGAAIRWLAKNTHQPFFLFVHYYDNHWDYCPAEPFARLYDPNYEGPIDGTRIAREPLFSNMPDRRDVEHLVALYDGEVRQTDEDLGCLLTALEEKDLLERSVVVILGDHGDQFYEHGNTSHHGLYEELIHVPLAVSVPGLAGTGKVIDTPVSQIDILPTILDCLNIPLPKACRGMSVLALMTTGGQAARPPIFAEYTGGAVADCFAACSVRYKCLQNADGAVFAFDLSQDPGEQHRIPPGAFTPELQDLAGALRRWKATVIKEVPSATN